VLRLAILQPDPRAAARLADALRSTHELRSYRSWSKLYSDAEKAPWAGCIIDIYPPDGDVPPTQLAALRLRRPELAIVIYSDFTDREADLFEVGREKFNAIILPGEDSTSAIQSTVSRSLASAAARTVETALEGRLATLGIAVVGWSMEHSFERPSVNELAAGMGMSRSQLARAMSRSGLPPPRVLMLWGRLFQAARLLQAGTTTVEGAALALGYSTSSALHRAFHQYVGWPPGAISTRGGLAGVIEAFIASQSDQAAEGS
jgi:AraC-like DNA-binding protein